MPIFLVKHFLCMLTSGLLVSTAALANNGSLGQSSSILDRLEKKLLQQGQASILNGSGTLPIYHHEEVQIDTTLPESRELSDLKQAIAGLSRRVTALSSDVETAKTNILNEARLNNYIEVEASLADPDRYIIQSLVVRIDGYDVYKLAEPAQAWLPDGKIPLYYGPIQPGGHRLDIQAQIAEKTNEPVPLNNSVYRLLNQSVNIEAPHQTSKRWTVRIVPDPNRRDSAKLIVSESDIG